jgi:uncharacterized spore protein YtfJ
MSEMFGGRQMKVPTEMSDVAADAARRAESGGLGERVLERLAEMVGAKATIRTVFGEPISRGEVTVVPVARVRWGFGGGGGQAADMPSGTAGGSGGGGGVLVDPVGYLELTDSGAAFRPIHDPTPSPAFLVAAGITAAIVLRALGRLLRS